MKREMSLGDEFEQLESTSERRNDQRVRPSFGEETQESLRSDRQADLPEGWPVPLGEAAYHGVVGHFVKAVLPHTEADPAALLVQTLVGVGNLIGRTPHFRVEAEKHHLNLFAAITGKSSKARKGTSWHQAARPLRRVDPKWAGTRIQHGLSTGEGLIHAVRDAGFDGKEQTLAVTDKRLLVIETELAKTLKAMARRENTLSATIRQAWDSGDLQTMTKVSPLKASGAHISIIGHITMEDLRAFLNGTDIANGFGNRFLWAVASRSKYLPEGGNLDESDLIQIAERMGDAVNEIRENVAEFQRDAEARRLWCDRYEQLSSEHPGAYGAITSRAEAQVVRLSCLYAALDQTATISVNHLKAALEVWRYCDDSARFLFAPPQELRQSLKERIARELQNAPRGLTKTEIRDLFNRNGDGSRIDEALAELEREGHAYKEEIRGTGGRPAEKWCFR